MIHLTLCGIPDEKYFQFRSTVLNLFKTKGVLFSFYELTALDELMKRGITKLPCIYIGNREVDLDEINNMTYETI